MWKPKRFHKRLHQWPTEFTTHVLRYDLDNKHNGTTVSLTVHLPSKRVSESYYDASGVLKRYVHTSSMADQHIKYLRAHDARLTPIINTSNSMKRAHDLYIEHKKRMQWFTRMCIFGGITGGSILIMWLFAKGVIII